MKLSSLGLALLEFIEDFRATAYQDQGGVWTCGFGHTGPDVHEGTTCTPEQASGWLAADVSRAELAVMRAVDVALTQHQFDALVTFTYNAGAGAFEHSTLLKLVNAHQPAADEFLKWDHVAGKPNAGLLRRRKVERALFLDGIST